MRIQSHSEECRIQSTVLVLSSDTSWQADLHAGLVKHGLSVKSFYSVTEVNQWIKQERSEIAVCLVDENFSDMHGEDTIGYLQRGGFRPDALIMFRQEHSFGEIEHGIDTDRLILPRERLTIELLPIICEQMICRIHAELRLSYEVSGEADKLISERIRLIDLHSAEIITRQKWDRTLLYASQACKTILGYEPEEITGKSLYRIIHPDDVPKIRENHVRFIETRTRIFNEVCRMRCHDGRYVWIESACRVIYNTETGLADEIISVSRDITDRQEMEELTKTTKLAEQANKTKSEFLANMSHEIRNPLSAVIGMAKTLEKTSLDEEQKGYLKSIIIASSNLMTILNDILDYAKIESKKMEVVYHHFNIRDMVNELVRIHELQADENNNKLSAQVEKGMPETIYADKQKIEQVLHNLLSNANKFTTNGKVRVSLELRRAAGEGNSINFKVEDTGIGVRKEDIPGLFVSFQQRDVSAKKEYQGTGLGLSIAKKLVDLMGGELDFTSEPGKGSTVSFQIPLMEYTEQPDGKIQKESPQGADKLLRILVVEDDAINQLYLAGFLRSKGWDVDTAYNGLAALDLFEPGKYDLILMDGQMPRMDGFETTRQIRKLEDPNSRTPIIAISGYAIPGDKDRFLEVGMDEYLSKPIDENQLLEVITRLAAG